ncbi:TetR/AcrR family transcriptional regulator [Flavobacterium laiguense]|uniref:TetR/AcrR family transcriptional regulator n=1 Tax=Flavobacterium laiguense TaxID=2169409 RepID=A0A2U1JP19_9FLAO|nr:TetR/AcrR family transcriptional regulator [Flavobacterium laiguense]PWA06724.1 TetR/AcrR family transcriptional regulator [Flavobacterium laiguense]
MARNKAFDEIEVLDKAVELFWTKGYNTTSANDLVDGLGLSRSSLYDTYGDKRSLFIKALKRYKHEFADAVITMFQETENVKETISTVLQLIIDQDCHAVNPKGCFIVNTATELSGTDPEIATIIDSNRQDFENAIENALKLGQQKGQISSKQDAKALARYFINTFFGLRVSIKANNNPKILKDIMTVSLSILD